MPAANENSHYYTNKKYRSQTTVGGVTYPWTSWSITGQTETLKRYRYITSVKTAGFKTMKRKYLPVNAYSKTVQIVSDPEIEWKATLAAVPQTKDSSVSHYEYRGNCASKGCSYDSVVSAEDPYRGALMKLLNNISEGKTNTMVSAAEMHKTVAHVAKTATRLYNAYKALRHGDFGGFTTSLGITTTSYQKRRFNKRMDRSKSLDKKTPIFQERNLLTESHQTRAREFAAETWLEFSYGWKPLLKDVYDHAKALAELQIERQNVIRFVKGRHKTTIHKIVYDAGSLETYVRDIQDDRRCEIGVSFKLQGGELNTFSQLGIDNPMEVAWEIVPFSFVADWFLPVGEYLRSLTATNGLIFSSGYKSVRNVKTMTSGFQGNGNTVISAGVKYGPLTGEGSASLIWLDIVRTKLDAFPTATFPSFKDPRSGSDYGLKKALSAISLLQSLFLSKKSNGSLRL